MEFMDYVHDADRIELICSYCKENIVRCFTYRETRMCDDCNWNRRVKRQNIYNEKYKVSKKR